MKFFLLSLVTLLAWSGLTQPVHVTINNNNVMNASYTGNHSPAAPEDPAQGFTFKQLRFSPTLFFSSAASLLGAYLGYQLWHIKASYDIVGNSECWCMWQAQVPLAALTQLPQSDVFAELVRTVNQKYTQRSCVWCPLLNDLQNEHQRISQGLKVLATLENLAIVQLLFDVTAAIEVHTDALKRIEYLQNLIKTELINGTA